MTSSVWSALGNTYVVVEPDPGRSLDPAWARTLVGDTDGIVEVVSAGVEDMSILIWNPDGSQAELSGNGTRIAAGWLAERTGASRITVRVAEREVVADVLENGEIEQDLGDVRVGPERCSPASHSSRFRWATRTRSSSETPPRSARGTTARNSRAIPRPHERPSRPRRRARRGHRPRMGARGGGDSVIRNECGRRRSGNSRGGEVLVHFPGGDLRVYLENGRARLTGPAVRVR